MEQRQWARCSVPCFDVIVATGSREQSLQLPFDKEFAGRGWDRGSLRNRTDKCGHAICWKRGGGNHAGAIGSGQEDFGDSNGASRRGGRLPPDVVLGVVLCVVPPSDCQGRREGEGGERSGSPGIPRRTAVAIVGQGWQPKQQSMWGGRPSCIECKGGGRGGGGVDDNLLETVAAEAASGWGASLPH